jgi:phage shock protein C
MSERRDEEFEKTVERWGREVGRKAEDFGRRVEEKAERWASKMERKAGRRTDREERRAARREGRAMRRHGSGERQTTLYRSRKGMICGVCKGIAHYYGFDVFWTRVLFVVASTFTGVWPAVFLYIVAAMVMKPEPVLPLESEEDEEFYQSYSGSRTMALHRLKRTYDNLNRRIQRLENTVTARDFDWDERLNR